MRSLIVLAVLAASIANAGWTLDQALDGVYWSKIAYCTNANIDRWDCGACPKFPNVTYALGSDDDALDDSSGYVAYYPTKNQIIYAFRGTVNLPGWIEDADFIQIPYPGCNPGSNATGCLVHQGLYAGYNRVKAKIWNQLQMIVNLYPTADVLVTGHSMGAGQSGFAYLDVVLNLQGHQGKKMLYNYGCPRLGNPAFVKYMQETIEPHGEHFRHTNFGDPIVHLAPLFFDDVPKLLGIWLHEPREIFFENAFANPRTHMPKVCAGNITHEDPTCADSTPWYDMIGFRNHTTYLDIGLGCFLGPSPIADEKPLSAADAKMLGDRLKGKGFGGGHKNAKKEHKLQRLSGRK